MVFNLNSDDRSDWPEELELDCDGCPSSCIHSLHFSFIQPNQSFHSELILFDIFIIHTSRDTCSVSYD
jgi:hypothetical protein